MLTATQELTSSEQLEKLLSVPASDIAAAAERRGMRPALCLDGRTYFEKKHAEVLLESIGRGSKCATQ